MYIGILWNTVNELYFNILNDIKNFCNISFFCEVNLGDEYNQFVKNIYELDGIADWKIDLKLQSMNQTNNKKIMLVFMEIDDSIKIFNSKKNKTVSVNIEQLKKFIREKYSKQIPNYFFDNVFHMTDNEEELVNTLEVLRNWFPEVYMEYKKLNPTKKYVK